MENAFSKSCLCCLSSDKPLYNISKCIHSQILANILAKLLNNLEDCLLCLGCHAILKKADLFQRQVEENCRLLQHHHDQCNKEEMATQRVKYGNFTNLEISSNITYVSIPEDFVEASAIKVEIIDDTLPYVECDFVCETDDVESKLLFRDGDKGTNVESKPLFRDGDKVTKRERKRKRTKIDSNKARQVKLKRVKRTNNNIDDEGKIANGVHMDSTKIRKVVLTHEELMADRQREMYNPSYLKLAHKCHTCIVGFDYQQTLQDHMNKRHKVKKNSLVCETCASVFDKPASFNIHCKRHYIRFECVPCGRVMMDKEAMKKHYMDAHGNTTEHYACDLCGFVSNSKRSHRYHKETHKERPQCAHCGRAYINKNSLQQHIMNIHLPTRGFPCDQCDKVYKGKSGLLMHRLSHGRTNGNSFCQPCKKQFKTVYTYHNHLKFSSVHTKEEDKRFVCEDCGAKFIKRRSLQEHMDWKHLKTNRHVCLICNKKYTRLLGLEKHIKYVHEKHRPPRNKMCDHCGKGFTTNAILESHIRTHTGERPLRCRDCPATFAHSGALYTHNKLLHKTKLPVAT